MARLGLPGILQRGLALRGRVAGAGRRAAAASGFGGEAGIRPYGKKGHPFGRGLAFLVALLLVATAQAQVVSSRIWPARDYTRLTLETRSETKFSVFSVKDPERLVVDLEMAELSPALAELNGKVTADDPYIQGLRVARNRPGIVRLVLDLKTEVKPQVFTLQPIGEY